MTRSIIVPLADSQAPSPLLKMKSPTHHAAPSPPDYEKKLY
jgi:hypothetical protein